MIIAKSTDRLRSASPADGRGHVTRSHTPYNVREEEMTSSDDTGGQVGVCSESVSICV